MRNNKDKIHVTFGIVEEIYDFYKIKAIKQQTDINTQLILALIENMRSEQLANDSNSRESNIIR
jgi:hypothetical protein